MKTAIDWDAAPAGYPIWIEDLKLLDHYDGSGWYREEGDRYSDGEGREWFKPVNDYCRVHMRPGTELKVKLLNATAQLPTYGSRGAACFDLSASFSNGKASASSITGTAVIETGLAFEIPADHVMLVFSRSGQGFKENTRLANCVGVIDQDYRGEVKVKLTRDDGGEIRVNTGDRIAQAMILPVKQVRLTEVRDLAPTARGDSGFGSTGN